MASAGDSLSTRDRRKQAEDRKARDAGTKEPEMDVESGAMINPHNPEFITKRPWYLGDSGPSLNHHASKHAKDHVLSMAEADAALKAKRESWRAATGGKTGAPAIVAVGAWIEALYRGKTPWLPAKVVHVRLDGALDLEFENGRKSTKVPRAHVKLPKSAAGARAGLEDLGKVTYDAKRDRWHGYDDTVYTQNIELHEKIDEERALKRDAEKEEAAKAKAKRAKARAKVLEAKEAKRASAGQEVSSSEDSDSDTGSDSDSDSDSDGGSGSEDEFKAGDTNFQKRHARQGGLGGAQMKTTVRNLRIREDTAKYLRNLDPDSAYYDPKSRAMRENPTPHVNPNELVYAGDNFARASGDALELAATQVFAWDVEKKGAALGGDVIHTLADPSRTELLRKEFAQKKAQLEETQVDAVKAKYGGLNAASSGESAEERRLRLHGAQSEAYVEYGADGRVVRGAPEYVAKSKYAEDVLHTNHTAVWGSYFCTARFKWGYADDHSVLRNSYSTGAAGRAANDAAAKARAAPATEVDRTKPLERPATTTNNNDDANNADAAAHKKQRHQLTARSDVYGSVEAPRDLELDEAKVKEAMDKIKRQQKEDKATAAEATDDRKRKYNSFETTDVTREEMEAYRRTKVDRNDPMANFIAEDA